MSNRCLWDDCQQQAMYGGPFCMTHAVKAREHVERGLAELEVFKKHHARFDAYLVEHNLPRESD